MNKKLKLFISSLVITSALLVPISASAAETTTQTNISKTPTANSIITTNSYDDSLYPINKPGHIVGSNVCFRNHPSSDPNDSIIYYLLQNGTSVYVLGLADNGYSKVTYNGITGYVYDAYVTW